MKEALARVPIAQFCKEIARGYFRALTKAIFKFTIFNIFNHLKKGLNCYKKIVIILHLITVFGFS